LRYGMYIAECNSCALYCNGIGMGIARGVGDIEGQDGTKTLTHKILINTLIDS
jgi:hypothetical protein